jgi:hypothetical protein
LCERNRIMRKKTIPWRFSILGSLVLLCLLLMVNAIGCKEKSEEIGSEEQAEEVVSKEKTKEIVREEEPKEIFGEELADGLAFALEEVPVADVDFSGPSRPRLLRRSGILRRSRIKIDGIRYDVLLAPYRGTDFCLIPKSNPQNYPRWLGAEQSKSTHAIGGKYYSFSKTPEGDKLLVRSFEGDFGTFEVGAGGRKIEEIGMQGSLRSKDTSVAAGGELENGWPKPAKSCRLPVGDYLPSYLTIIFGRLRISVSNNYYSDGQRRRGSRTDVYGIKVRQDKPFIFDFSNKPEVIFVSPAKDHRVKLGQELKVEAVLIDPELDIMIRRLYDTTRKEKKEYATPDGQKRTFERDVSLDPKVIITRANGEKVDEGVMPFG